ncbi:PREDICTED: uncharacterized protein LOC105147977 [Acromyrmex echinatior]|uniref:uncharacterized protein LOC105147977 n=1 Tax=Acromyrmex echinatior TaxID=103372 RepID=UPI000580F3E1|nr:PREDICTED: uncharacterized protein LOC105147977 [Acromyrmex echinatior]
MALSLPRVVPLSRANGGRVNRQHRFPKICLVPSDTRARLRSERTRADDPTQGKATRTRRDATLVALVIALARSSSSVATCDRSTCMASVVSVYIDILEWKRNLVTKCHNKRSTLNEFPFVVRTWHTVMDWIYICTIAHALSMMSPSFVSRSPDTLVCIVH